MKYIGAGTVSFVGFLLATACGQGGGAGGGPPSWDGDGTPDSYDDIPPSTEVVPGDPNRPVTPVTDGVPNNQDEPPPGVGGATCGQFCTAIIASGCATGESELTVGDCKSICTTELLPQPCAGQLIDAFVCLIGLLPAGTCDFEELEDDEEGLAACYTPLLSYAECADLDDGGNMPEPPNEGTVTCTCTCACEYGCVSTETSVCSASQAQSCYLCDDACESYCAFEDCGVSITPAATPATCVGE